MHDAGVERGVLGAAGGELAWLGRLCCVTGGCRIGRVRSEPKTLTVVRAWGKKSSAVSRLPGRVHVLGGDGSKEHNKAAGSQRSSRMYDVRKGPFESGGGAAQQKAKGDG